MIFHWIPKNLIHIAGHDVEPGEAMYVVDHARKPYPRDVGDDKYLVWGQTAAGRYLQVIFIYPEDEDIDLSFLGPEDRLSFLAGDDIVVYVVHARDLSPNERRSFRRTTRGRS